MFAASTTILDCPAERAWQEAQTSRLLAYVAWPLVVLQPIQPTELPESWAESSYLVRMRLFGCLPFGNQSIVISRPFVDPTPGRQRYVLRDNGHGNLITTWDHVITIRETEDGRTHYTDRVEIRAGILTPFIWSYASLFYRHRQRRWRRLARTNFSYSA
jgi:hypothetical protein